MTHSGDFSYPISKKLGKKLGLPAALMLGQLEYWTQREAGIVHDSLRWIYNSFRGWSELLEVLTPSQVRRALRILRDRGLVLFKRLKKHQWDQTGHYAIVREKVDELLEKVSQEADSTPPKPELNQSSTVIDEEEEANIEEAEAVVPKPKPKPKQPVTLSPKAKAIVDRLDLMGVGINPNLEKEIAAASIRIVKKAYDLLIKLKYDGKMPLNPGGWFVDALRNNCWKEEKEGSTVKQKQWFEDAYAAGLVRAQEQDLPTGAIRVFLPDGKWRSLDEMMELHPDPKTEVLEPAAPPEDAMRKAVERAIAAGEIRLEKYFYQDEFVTGVKELGEQMRWWGTIREWFEDTV